MRKLVGCPECAAIFGVDLDPTPTASAEVIALHERFAVAALTGWLANPENNGFDERIIWGIATAMMEGRQDLLDRALAERGAGTPVAGADRPFDPKPPPDLSAMKVPE